MRVTIHEKIFWVTFEIRLKHISIRREKIVYDDEDRERLLKILSRAKER
jgi:hypothetical protein